MSRFLMIDIGAGTMDILYYDSESGNQYKAVSKSPVLSIAEKLARIPGNLLMTGNEMGGGAVSEVLKERAKKHEVAMTISSSFTIHHDPERVRSLGIKIVDERRVKELKKDVHYSHIAIGDLEIERLKDIIMGLGVPFSFDVVGVCAQDHGIPPGGMSHLDYRHNLFKVKLDKSPSPHTLLYRSDEVPSTMNRLTSIAESAGRFLSGEIYVMDSGMAAILGASLDRMALKKKRILVLDVATSHTVGAAMEGRKIAGFFEYHTSDITLDRLELLLVELADGKLEHKKVLYEGGHGAYIRKALGFQAVEAIIATGPKRILVKNSRLPIIFGAPLGDNMMTGTAGLLEAIRIRKGLEPFFPLE